MRKIKQTIEVELDAEAEIALVLAHLDSQDGRNIPAEIEEFVYGTLVQVKVGVDKKHLNGHEFDGQIGAVLSRPDSDGEYQILLVTGDEGEVTARYVHYEHVIRYMAEPVAPRPVTPTPRVRRPLNLG